MILITNHIQLSDKFSLLCKQYNHYKWAVAWAGKEAGFKLADILSRNRKKIERLIVGLHFYQTDPIFIQHYMNDDAVRFMKQTEGVFHPKVYLFYNSLNDWSAIVGSSNFTYSAFNKNNEVNVCFNQDDGNDLFRQLDQYVEDIWNDASDFTFSELDRYRSLYESQKPRLDSLRKTITDGKRHRIGASEIDVMTWDSYMNSIRGEDPSEIQVRIRLLKKAQELFVQYSSFIDIPLVYRKCLAGFAERMPGLDNVDCRYFGSMQGAGQYKKAINSGTAIAKAIDIIPLQGEITKKQFNEYCRVFKRTSKNPLACATRLLAMKRPDVFICIDSKNKKRLCKAFRIPQSHLTLDSYWELIVERVKGMVWFEQEGKGRDKDVKRYQVAMMDCFYYEE